MVQTQFSFYKETQRAWLQDARGAVTKLLNAGYPYVTSDTVWTHCPPPKLIHRNTMGQVFRGTDFQSIGWTASKRPTSHGRAIQKYKLRTHEDV